MKAKERQRVFLALPLSTEIRQGIQHFQIRHTHLEQPGFRWIPAENLHITLFYLGPVLLKDTGPVCDRIRPLLAANPPLQLRFQTFSAQPPGRPRMLWAQFHLDDRFTALARGVATACEPYLLERKQQYRQPIPHATIARMKRIGAALILHNDPTLPELTVRRAELWLSESGPRHAVYTPLASFDFLTS